MKKLISNIPASFSLGLSLLFFLALSGSVWAGAIVAVHGHSGNIEYPDRVYYGTSTRHLAGWGLDFKQKGNTDNWIHYSIPTPLFSKTRYLAIRFKTGSVESQIHAIHVYNGGTKIYDSGSLDLYGDTYGNSGAWYIVDMGSDKTIDKALGLSINVEYSGIEQMDSSIVIYAVAAEWH